MSACSKRAWGVYDVFTDGRRQEASSWAWSRSGSGRSSPRRLGEPALSRPGLRDQQRPLAGARDAHPLVAGMLARRSCAEIEAMCEEAGLPFARVQTPSDLFDDPQLAGGRHGGADASRRKGPRAPAPPPPVRRRSPGAADAAAEARRAQRGDTRPARQSPDAPSHPGSAGDRGFAREAFGLFGGFVRRWEAAAGRGRG